MINIGVIGYGVRVDMLMDSLFFLKRDVRIKAITDINKPRVEALMKKDVPYEDWYGMELDKIDANLRECPMNPEDIT
ncbi:MAG: hypothetical protein RR448_11010, partial [Niameybacter sp.]